MMKSLGQMIAEEVDQLTLDELRVRLASAECLIYALENKIKDSEATIAVKSGQHPNSLYGTNLYNMIEDGKKARVAYDAARKGDSFRAVEDEKRARAKLWSGDGILIESEPDKKTSDAVEILHSRYIKDDPARKASVQAERELLKTPMTDERLEELKAKSPQNSDFTSDMDRRELIDEVERLKQWIDDLQELIKQ